MKYREASDYMLSTINESLSRREPHRLDRMRTFLQRLGDPHLRYPTIHVGGTSGKWQLLCTLNDVTIKALDLFIRVSHAAQNAEL